MGFFHPDTGGAGVAQRKYLCRPGSRYEGAGTSREILFVREKHTTYYQRAERVEARAAGRPCFFNAEGKGKLMIISAPQEKL